MNAIAVVVDESALLGNKTICTRVDRVCKTDYADLHFFTFIKYLFTQRDLLHTGWLVEKMINHVAVI